MYPINSIDKILMFNTKERNVLVVDMAMSYHIAVYNGEKQTFTNFHTRKIISEPVMWDYLPEFDEVCFEKECDRLNAL